MRKTKTLIQEKQESWLFLRLLKNFARVFSSGNGTPAFKNTNSCFGLPEKWQTMVFI
jgi:hypothetical protein